MLKYYKYVLVAACIAMLSASCNKWLEVKPQDGIIRDDYWKTKEQFEAAVVFTVAQLATFHVCKIGALGKVRDRNYRERRGFAPRQADLLSRHLSPESPLRQSRNRIPWGTFRQRPPAVRRGISLGDCRDARQRRRLRCR